MKTVGKLAAFGSLVIALSGCGDEESAPETDGLPSIAEMTLPAEFIPVGDEFMVAMIPDSQIYAEQFPDTFERQMQWLAEHSDEYRIEFVSHVGDIVQNGAYRPEWEVARAAYDYLDDYDVPHGLALGGHDMQRKGRDDRDDFAAERADACQLDGASLACVSPGFYENFRPEFYVDRPWYSGASPSGLTSYQVIELEGLKLLFLHVAQDFPEAEVAFAGEVVDANADALVHITTHKYLFDYRLTDAMPFPLNLAESGRMNAISHGIAAASDGNGFNLEDDGPQRAFFNNFIRRYPNIWGLHCGHVDAEFRQVSENARGLPVHEVLIDFQNMDDGGGGWLRLLLFKPSENVVQAITFSTTTGRIRGNGDGFDHSIDVLKSYAEPAKSALGDFGLSEEDVDEILVNLSTPGHYFREDYRESLYGDGQRDSVFTMDVDFAAYVAAEPQLPE